MPFVHEGCRGGETIDHLLIECNRWDDARERHIGQLIDVVKGMIESVEGWVKLILGGEYSSVRVKSWLPVEDEEEEDTFHFSFYEVWRKLNLGPE